MFKDCANCPLVEGLRDERERRGVCNPCQVAVASDFDVLPASPPAEFLANQILSFMPDGMLTAYGNSGEISVTRMVDITAIKESRSGF